MIDISTLQTISIAIASAGVFAAAIYYIIQIKHQTKLRQTDLIIRLYSFTGSKDFLEALDKVKDREIGSVDDYKERYGSLVEINQLLQVFAELGMLLKRKLIDIDLIDDLIGQRTVLAAYEKLDPLNEAYRKEQGIESDSFDYLYNEMKRYQRN
ncbi:hypothetical protein COS86_05205 [Candidatus Bathyarchaeota archaeon CG07_land_8_20_14_0_80_47_9]|jgi:hypothetical protein|nr:MAG: hypothetical protein COS86_05205 [Candidatus Bathyarchaeota archaeon CG07_land_8_20_14_0_80_47_9]